MKIAIIIFALVLIAFFIFIFSKRSDDTTTSVGSIDDIENNIEKIMRSTKKDAFLIAKVHGTSDFIQFTGDAKGVQLDFPLVTDRQKSMETAFRSVAKELNLEIVGNRGSGGQNFLDIDIKGTTAEITVIARTLMEKLFRVNQNTKIEYELNA
jgi:hypothetical protein